MTKPAHGRLTGGKPEIADLRVERAKTIEPDPRLVDALIQNYPLAASIADLVDNSIDAGARNVLVRVVKRGGTLKRICVVDDGHGMDDKAIDLAMKFAGRRKYGSSDLGMFGVGLKSASLSQAEVVTVLSRSRGRSPVGRQWVRDHIRKKNWECFVLERGSVEAQLRHQWGRVGKIASRGTIVRWDNVKDFLRLQDGYADEFIESMFTKVRSHIGLKLHRFLERKQVSIFMDVEDLSSGEVGPPSRVEPLRPFPDAKDSGAKGFPMKFKVEIPRTGSLEMTAHIWPKRSSAPGYKLGRGKVSEHQGFYFYRHNRLIQDGGWNGVRGNTEPHLSLARVEIDIPDGFGDFFKISPNKADLQASPLFARSMKHAKAARGGLTFEAYLELAERIYRKKKAQSADPMVAAGDGIPAMVRNAVEAQGIRKVKGRPMTIVWGRLPPDKVFEIQLRRRALVLNQQFRHALLGGQNPGGADVPLLRALVYLLLEPTFQCRKIGKVERIRLEVIQAALLAAVKLEIDRNGSA